MSRASLHVLDEDAFQEKLTRQDVTAVIERINKGDAPPICTQGVIIINGPGHPYNPFALVVAAHLAQAFDPALRKLTFGQPEGQEWILGSREDVTAFAQFVREKGKGLIEQILRKEAERSSQAR